MIDFRFPRLGATGEGDPVYPPGKTAADFASGERPVYWTSPAAPAYSVTYQLDRPACAFRCHYPHGSSPCNQETADRFVLWVRETIIEPGRRP